MAKVGQLMSVRGMQCRVFKLHPLGTLDVVSLCGRYAFRLTGLPVLTKADAGHPDNVIL